MNPPSPFAELQAHPSPGVRLNYGMLAPRMRTPQEREAAAGTGSPIADLLFTLGRNWLVPQQASAPPTPRAFSPGPASRVGPHYLQAMGHASTSQDVLQQLMAQQSLLGQLGRHNPEWSPMLSAMDRTMADPRMMQAFPQLAQMARQPMF